MKIKPKKSLGQNFLNDESVIRKIVALADLKKEDVVLEIGPGKGILTESLASGCQKVIAVEIDPVLVDYLKKKFKGNDKIEIVQGDILQMSNFQFPMSNQIPNPKSKITEETVKSYKLIANLPYYITSPIIRKFLESENPPQEMILMVQKEVAERIVAKPGEMSILGVSVQYYAQAEILFFVPRTAFDPVPEVESAVLKITNHKSQVTNKKETDNFFRVVRAGFCAKRKTLANNLANSFHLERKAVEEKMAAAGLAANVRAQELSVEDWKRLCATIEA